MKVNYLELTKEIIFKHIDSKKFKVFLFGSRACGNQKPFSDIDIGIIGKEKLNSIVKADIENELDESLVPYNVDIVDFSRVDAKFKSLALKKIIKWN